VELHHASVVFVMDAVEEDRVDVGVEAQVTRRPLDDEHSAALTFDAVLGEPAAVEREYGVSELPTTAPRSAPSNPRRLRHAKGTVRTHWRRGTFGIT
jgi:hypothetical protein